MFLFTLDSNKSFTHFPPPPPSAEKKKKAESAFNDLNLGNRQKNTKRVLLAAHCSGKLVKLKAIHFGRVYGKNIQYCCLIILHECGIT
jgi:hypothetical protein